MKNRGFTLIEIIVCIAILSVISVSVIVVTNNNNKDELLEITNEILNSSRLFIELEKDENGKNYSKEIINGAKGVKIPLKTLVQKGYVDEKDANKIYDKKSSLLTSGSQDFYVMFINSGGEEDYCELGEITSIASWMIEDKPIYLCNNNSDNSNEVIENVKNYFDLINTGVLKYEVDTSKFAVSTEYIEKLTSEGKDISNLTDKENGMYVFNQDGEMYVYYRGAVDNNYLKLGKDSSGNELVWRIIWLRDDNKVKLVLNDTVKLKTNHSNKLINTDSKMIGISLKIHPNYYYSENEIREKYLSKCEADWTRWRYCYVSNYYYIDSSNSITEVSKIESTYKINNIDVLSEKYDILGDENIETDNNFYYSKLLEWYNGTNLKDYNLVTKEENFCVDKGLTYLSSNGNYSWYAKSNNFICNYVDLDDSLIDTTISTPVYFLNYGDVVLAGISESGSTDDLSNSGNYLFTGDETILLSRAARESYNSSNDYEWDSWYVLNNSKIDGTIYYETYGTNYSEYNDKSKTFIDSSTNEIIDSYQSSTYAFSFSETKFVTNVLKPSIILDITDYNFEKGNGTKTNPYELSKK